MWCRVMSYFVLFICLTLFASLFYRIVNFKDVKFFKSLPQGIVITIISQIMSLAVARIVKGYNILKINESLNLSKNFHKPKFMVAFIALSLVTVIVSIFLIRMFKIKIKKENVDRKYKWILSLTAVFLYTFLVMSFFYLELFFPELNLDQLLFTLGMPITGTSTVIIVGCVLLVFCVPFIVVLLSSFCIWKKIQFTLNVDKLSWKIFPIHIKHGKIALSLFFVILVSSIVYRFDLISFIKLSLKENSLFYEENYIDPRNLTFKFPEQKKNLILIYLESMEAEAASTANPGVNFIPELSKLAEENISFSHNDGLGGQLQLAGTGWSMASICCTHLGIPLTLSIGGNSYENTTHFFNGAYGLGDLLKDNGYKLSFVMGADAEFGGLRALLKTHGNFDIKDANYYRKAGYVPKNYNVWWGIEDKKIIEYSKEELINLSNDNKPFMFSVFLEDTHSPGGYMDEDCEKNYTSQIHNVFSCTSKRVARFIDWIKTQKFYDNTVIVMLGDHLYMGGDLYTQKKTIYERHAYNVFINTGKEATFSKNRAFATFDFFPTIIEAMGIEYNGDGLGIGRSLFSNKPTLLEQYGEKQLNEFINSKSYFYRNELLNKKELSVSMPLD